MSQNLRNVVVVAVAAPIAYVLMHICKGVWAKLFTDNRSFTVYFDVISAFDIINWTFYFIYFGFFACTVSALLRTSRPFAWAVAFGLAVYILAETTTTYISFSNGVAEEIYAIAQRALVLSAMVSGCTAGVLMLQRIRALAPNYSLKRIDQSLRD